MRVSWRSLRKTCRLAAFSQRVAVLLVMVLTVNGALGSGSAASIEQARKAMYEEYETRAAFLVIFAKYSEWPSNRLSDAFVIGILGDTPFGPALEQVNLGSVKNRKVVVKRFRSVSELQPCNILYFPSAEEHQLAGLRGRLAAENVLTVGETSLFLGLGGGLQLFQEEGHLRFVVNLAVLDQSHIRVEAKALSLAKRVINQL